MPNGVIQIITPIIQSFEGLYLSPYLCPAGVPTIGYGATFYLDGRKVSLQDSPITETHANLLLSTTLTKRYIPNTNSLCPGLSTYQLAALTDFTFNLGEGRLRASTLRRYVLEGKLNKVPDELIKWTVGGGRKLSGLEKRRKQEILLWLWKG